MNPLTNVKNITKLNEIELAKGTKKSWHDIYKDSAWIFIGGLAYGLTEGDILAVFSQYGEIVNINLVRDKKTGKTKGFCFLCYANQKSTILAVDNFNGIKLCNRTIRVDHVSNYKPPKEDERDDEITKKLKGEGCAPKPIDQNSVVQSGKDKKKAKKEKKKKKKNKKQKHRSDESDDEQILASPKIKKERHDPGYDKYESSTNSRSFENTETRERSRAVDKSDPSTPGDRSGLKGDRQSHQEKQQRIKEKNFYADRCVEGEKSYLADRQDFERLNNRHEGRSKRHSEKHETKKGNDRKQAKERHLDSPDPERNSDHHRKRDARLDDKWRNRSVSADSSSSSSSTSSEENHRKERQSKHFSRVEKRKCSGSESSSEDERTTKAKKLERIHPSRSPDRHNQRKHGAGSSSCKKEKHRKRRQSSDRSS